MNEQTTCILVVTHDPDNTYHASAFARVCQALKHRCIVPLSGSTYIVVIPDAIEALLAAAAVEIRSKDTRKIRFCLIPSGSRLFGELPEPTVAALAAAGLSYLETPFPAPLPLG